MQGIAQVDADIPVPEAHTMPEVIAQSVQQRRFQAWLLSAFGALAVRLAAIGIFGIVAHSVLQRRKEIGVRLALGAGPEDVRRLILQNGMLPVVAGLGAGLLAAGSLSRFMA